MEFAQRMAQFETSVFAKINVIKARRLAAGNSVVDLSIGTPNIPPSDAVVKTIVEEASDKKNYVYAISDLPVLKEAVASWYQKRYEVTLDPATEVISLLGSQDGLTISVWRWWTRGTPCWCPIPAIPPSPTGPASPGDSFTTCLRPRRTIMSSTSTPSPRRLPAGRS
jgi:LL-diaminopimelate aminotransferase